MAGWYDQFDGQKFEQALGIGDGQGSLAWPDAVHVTSKSWS